MSELLADRPIRTLLFVALLLEIAVVALFDRRYLFIATSMIGLRLLVRRFDLLGISASVLIFASALFVFLPPHVPKDMPKVYNGVAALVAGSFFLVLAYFRRIEDAVVRQSVRRLWDVQMLLLLASAFNVYVVEESLAVMGGLPWLNHFFSWFLLLASIVSTMCSPLFDDGSSRLAEDGGSSVFGASGWVVRSFFVFYGLASEFTLLSVGNEFSFFVVFSLRYILLLKPWLRSEEPGDLVLPTGGGRSSPAPPPAMSFHLFDVAGIFFVFTFLGFFGTGSFASFAAFNIQSVYRFLTKFLGYQMMFLLLLKTVTPHAVLFATPVGALFSHRVFVKVLLAIVSFADLLSVHYFFMQRTSGSWEDIGNDIALFVLANQMPVAIYLVGLLSYPMARNTFRLPWLSGPARSLPDGPSHRK